MRESLWTWLEMEINMFNKIYEKIKEYDNIVIARHIGVDPDAMCSQIALRDSIKLTFPKKNVIAVGSGSSKFNDIGSSIFSSSSSYGGAIYCYSNNNVITGCTFTNCVSNSLSKFSALL